MRSVSPVVASAAVVATALFGSFSPAAAPASVLAAHGQAAPSGTIADAGGRWSYSTAQPKITRTSSLYVGRGAKPAGVPAAHFFHTVAAALASASPGATIGLASGRYVPFTVTTPGVTVAALPHANAEVVGKRGVANNILVRANGVTLSGLNVTGCIPAANPPSSFEMSGSSGVRIDDGTSGVSLLGLKIHGKYGKNDDGRRFGCYGVMVAGATDARVIGNRIYHNGYGVFEYGGGRGVRIAHNLIHDNHALIRNTTSPDDDDYGADAIGFTNAHGSTATSNVIFDNYGPSHDYGTDGGAFEIFNASDIAISRNTMYDNEDVLETGAGKGGNCRHNVFADNQAQGRVRSHSSVPMAGIILRCADHMRVSGNQLGGMDWWSFWIYQPTSASPWGGRINQLSITGNRVVQSAAEVYSFTSPVTGLHLTIRNNHYSYKGTFCTNWDGKHYTYSAWRRATSFS